MSAPSAPPDNSLQIEQMQENQAAQAKADADAKTAKDASDLAALRTSSAASGNKATDDYFASQGLDPKQYQGDIDSKINSILTGIGTTDPNPGSSFLTAPQDIYQAITAAGQSKDLQGVNSIFSPTYSADRATNSLTDPYVNDIASTQRSSADDIITNMLKRGVITDSGKTAAEAELDRQQPGVLDQLKTLGQGTISGEQSALDAIANKGRQDAQTATLGQTFDPTKYGKQADDQFNDFVNNLGNTLKGKVTGNLFNTTGLAAIAGAGQGAGNTNFDPSATGGPPGSSSNDGFTDSTTGKPVNTGTNNSTQSVF